MAGDRDDDAEGRDAPRQTYMPKPPSKEEVDQISREQGMIADDWTGEPSAGEGGKSEKMGGSPEGAAPGGKRGGGWTRGRSGAGCLLSVPPGSGLRSL